MSLLRAKRFHLITSEAINDEVLEVLNRPKIRDKYGLKDHFFDISVVLWGQAEVVIDPKAVRIIVKDPDDDKFLAAAHAGDADYLVSGDEKHVLPLKEWKGIKILNPVQFLEKMKG